MLINVVFNADSAELVYIEIAHREPAQLFRQSAKKCQLFG